ncbi:MAG TPA: hypothetical protein VKZ53_29550 [Candidatus Angelobacter sp.]|nr:hypothetical protein [Candidatus Angelobacter sp.]
MHELLAQCATGDQAVSHEEYRSLRRDLISDPYLNTRIPRCVLECAELGEFWAFIKTSFSSHHQRRDFLNHEFQSIIAALGESGSRQRCVMEPTVVLGTNDVQLAWQTALSRSETDPAGAITSAQVLLQTVCRQLLASRGVEPASATDPAANYFLAVKSLDLTAGELEPVLRRILSGCCSILSSVDELASFVAPEERHSFPEEGPASRSLDSHSARLAVSVACSVATFLVQTYRQS